MLSSLAGVKPLRLLLLLASVLVLAGVLLWFGQRHDDRAEVPSGSSASSWKTVEYRGVQVDVPGSWVPVDMDACEFQYEVLAPPVVTGCDWAGGVAFYGSATFDPAHRPGVRRGGSRGEPGWGGYTYAGDFAVYASDDDRKVVARVLRSTR